MLGRALVILFALTLAGRVDAQQKLRVQCVDRDGQPVKDAEVYLWQQRKLPDDSFDFEQAGPFSSGADGFADTALPVTYNGDNYMRWVYARVPGKLVGTLRTIRQDFPGNIESSIITLQPSRTVRGQVDVPEGVNPESVVVKVVDLAGLDDSFAPRDYFPRNKIVGVSTLPMHFDCRVAADGGFVFHDFPLRPRVTLMSEAPGCAHEQWSTRVNKARAFPDIIRMSLQRESVLGGIVSRPDGRPAVDAVVELQLLDGTARYRWRCEAKVDATGRFRLRGLASGKYAATVSSKEGILRLAHFEIASQTSKTDLALRLEQGIEVRGTVKDDKGRPAEGVVLGVVTNVKDSDYLGSARTDPQGRFAILLPAGPAHIYIFALPARFVRESPNQSADLAVTADDPSLRELRFEVRCKE